MPEIATAHIHVSVDQEQLRETITKVLEERDSLGWMAEEVARKHNRATERIRELTERHDIHVRDSEKRAAERTAERIEFQRKISNLEHELRAAQVKLRKADYGIHNFPTRIVGKDGATYGLRLDANGEVEYTRSAPGAGVPPWWI
jgi:ABC-type phosphate transport system auxiliary subunit